MPQPTFTLTRLPLLRCFGGALALVIGLTGASVATASTAKPTAPAAMASMDLSGLKSSHGYTPALGETLERIVAKTIPDSPLSLHLLSEAFVALNPQAFGNTKPQRTLSTNALKVPNHNQLLHLVLSRLPADTATAKPIPAPAPSRPPEKRENWLRYAGGPIKTPSSFDASAEERRNWVQYLGAALPRNWMGEPAAQAESRQWVQYPSAARAVSVADGMAPAKADMGKWVQYPLSARASTPAAVPESRLDTGNWVRYVATRIYPQQQFAQLFD